MLTAFEKNHMNFDHSKLSKIIFMWQSKTQPSAHTVKNIKESQWFVIEIDWSASVWLSLIQEVY